MRRKLFYEIAYIWIIGSVTRILAQIVKNLIWNLAHEKISELVS